jgi:nickel/cobalt transporter (NicO) family protein
MLPANMMETGSAGLLVLAVFVVGVLHTVVPDHWVPITLLARQQGWSRAETARAALQAGTGHVVTTLILAVIVWLAGVAVATEFGRAIDTLSSIALVGFGAWIAIASWRESHGGGHGHHHHSHRDHHHADSDAAAHRHDGHPHHHHHHHENGEAFHGVLHHDALYLPMKMREAAVLTHLHPHRHAATGLQHAHRHDHTAEHAHALTPVTGAEPPLHEHRHKIRMRAALLIILGSSPMIEGIPVFFAAGKYGVKLIVVMSLVFAASTIATYVLICTYSTAQLQRVRLGALERYGEVASGVFIALVGVAFWVWPVI